MSRDINFIMSELMRKKGISGSCDLRQHATPTSDELAGLNQPTVAENLVAGSLQKRTWTHHCLPPFWGLTNQSNQISQFPRKTIKVTRYFFLSFFKYFLLFSSKSRVNSAHHITAFFTRPWCAVFYLTIFLAFLLIYMLL